MKQITDSELLKISEVWFNGIDQMNMGLKTAFACGYRLAELREIKEDEEELVLFCIEPHCKNPATKDYNGHGHFVCDYHYEKLNDYFDEEYD